MPGHRRCRLWRPGRGAAASACPGNLIAALPGETAGRGDGARAATHARRAPPPRLPGRRGAACRSADRVTAAAAIELRALSAGDAAAFREIRLEGLLQDPDAFGSTHESESTQPLSFFAD